MALIEASKRKAKERIVKLKELITKYRYHRLVLDRPIIEESAEDSLKKELFDLEQQFPELVTPDSPTQRVAGKPLSKFEKFTHPTRMLSFNDAFSREDMEDWIDRLARAMGVAIPKDGLARRSFAEQKLGGFYCELKIDGLAIELLYENGILKVGATRGNGIIGENVTQNLKTVEAIPLKLETGSYKLESNLVVRGEVFIGKKEFAKVNKEQAKEGGVAYANPRNLAAGSVRQLNPAVTASRKLDSYAYSLITDLGQKVHEDEHKILHELKFKTNPHNKFCKDLEEVQNFRDYWEKHRENLNYEIDGIVVIVNDNKMFNKLGVVGKAPRAAIAYKFSPRESTTKVKDIIVGIGRTGVLTPVAVLEPVEIGGTSVSRATLHNEDEIRRLDVRVGDTVVVGRAGDVIPDIKGVIKELRTGREKKFHFPIKCPVCAGPVKRIEGEAAHKCMNKNCPAVKREAIYHFISRGAMDIDGVGPKIIDQLMDTGLIIDAADLYSLTKDDLLNLERFAERSAQNTIGAIQARKKAPLDRFVFALGIPHVGIETALDLARRFGTFEKLAKASIGELEGIKDIGGVVAQSIYDWFRSDYNQKLLLKFRRIGLRILKQELAQKSLKLKGLTFVFTGTLDTLSREQAEEIVRENSGDVSSAVSRETDYVVAGAEPGSKYEKAKKLGVKTISEREFMDMLK
ncbi:MAG: NAD-dependent DNA ligase LigA [Candidatus Yanofskybacteria bacterium]|nr:NAD-dependent DNA ligase LigA [Candidatus Yanofskybacteria bacterium]